MPAPKPPAQSGPSSWVLSRSEYGRADALLPASGHGSNVPRGPGDLAADRAAAAGTVMSWPKPSRDETGSRMAQSRGLAGWGVNRRAQATFFVTPAASANVFLSSTRKKSSLASRRMFLKPHPPTMTQECRGRIDPSRQCGGTSMVLGVRTEDSEGGSAPLSVSADL